MFVDELFDLTEIVNGAARKDVDNMDEMLGALTFYIKQTCG